MNLATARSELQNIIGADLDDTEADRLLNDGIKELCVRAEWTRATIAVGPTVAGQRDYAMTGSIYRPLKLFVDGLLFDPADDATVAQLVGGTLSLRDSNGLWWVSSDANVVDNFSLYPTPTTAGLAITALCVVIPEPIEDDTDFFASPQDFHQGAIYYAAARSLGGSEDDFDARSYYMDQFDGLVGRLKRLRRSRNGSGPVNMRIAGWTA